MSRSAASSRHPGTLATSFTLALLTTSFPVFADVIEVGPSDDVSAAIGALAPGDELVLQGGTYELSARFGIDVAGTEVAPILIRAKDGERPHLHRAAVDQNIVDVDRAEYVTIRGVEFSGGSAGIRLSGARFLTIEDCEVHDTGDVALRANDTGVLYESVRFLRNHIHHTNNTGEGMYLGCNSGACQFANGLIEGNYVHHTNGPTVVQGDGIEIKEGSYNNIVRDNVIHDTAYPCILTYSTAGNGAPNVIERNLLFNCGDHGIQSAADAVIRNNVVLSASSDGIALQPHQSGSPSNLVVVHNTVLDADGDALSLRTPTGSVVIANNALYTSGAGALYVDGTYADVVITGNVVQGTVEGPTSGTATGDLAQDFVAASFTGAPPNDVFPAPGGALVAAGDAAHVVADDFNATARGGVADVGAYAFASSGNPGWVLAAEPKSSGLPNGSGGSGGNAGAGGLDTGGGPSVGGTSGGGGGLGGGAAVGTGGTTGGTGGSASLPGGAGGRLDAGDGGFPETARSGDDSGCSCGIGGGGTRNHWVALAAFGLVLIRRYRRVRRAP